MNKEGLIKRKISTYSDVAGSVRISSKVKIGERTITLTLSEAGGGAIIDSIDELSILFSDVLQVRSRLGISSSDDSSDDDEQPKKSVQSMWAEFRKFQYERFKKQCLKSGRSTEYQSFLPMCSAYWKDLSKPDKMNIDVEKDIDWIEKLSSVKLKTKKKKSNRM